MNLDISRDKIRPADQEVMLDPVLIYRSPDRGRTDRGTGVFFAGNLCPAYDWIPISSAQLMMTGACLSMAPRRVSRSQPARDAVAVCPRVCRMTARWPSLNVSIHVPRTPCVFALFVSCCV